MRQEFPPRLFLIALNRKVVRLERGLAGSLVVVVAVLAQVILRHVFARPNQWSKELSRFCFIWLSLLGASLAVERNSQFVFDQMIQSLPDRFGTHARVSKLAVVLLSALAFLVLGANLLAFAGGQRSPALDIPMKWVYASVPVTGALMLVHLFSGLSPSTGDAEGRDP